MRPDELNSHLLNDPNGLAQLQTPALVIDLDRLQANITRMAAHAEANGVGLRPHAKTHKCAEIARRQIAAGAGGICVAKLGEAEAFADQGISSMLVTSPVVSEGGIARLLALNSRVADLMAVCDESRMAHRLSEAAAAAGKPINLLVDIDPGTGRTGVRPGERALALVTQVAAAPGLVYRGLQCYAGHLQHFQSRNERRNTSLDALAELRTFCGQLADEGLAPEIVSGGGTGTFDIDPEARVLTELQVGSYIFMDRQYNDVWQEPGQDIPFETSLFVATTVISANREGLATTDAGFKAFATDAGAPSLTGGAPAGASYFFFGDEQGGVLCPDEQLETGSILTCIVPHCDPTVNLYDCYHVVQGGRLVAIWPIEARGRSA
jgi:D-serine deaminase-like pyridoxal phosphate-dependent protein